MTDELIPRTREESVWKRLTRLFRSGPVVRHKIAAGEKLQEPRGTARAYKREISSLYVHSMASYGQYERLSRYADYCFAPDTIIYTHQGPRTIKELSEQYTSGARFQVYAYDFAQKKVVVADAHSARLKREGQECDLLEITLDDGGSIKVTGDHLVAMRDGGRKRADELQSGDSLMPFYKKDLMGQGYQWIYTMDRSRSANGWELEHRVVAEYALGRELDEHEVVHHKNFGRADNRPENLDVMLDSDHQSYHAKLNNRAKKGKPNQKHSVWMKEGGSHRREDVNFASIVRVAISTNFVLKSVIELLKTDATAVRLRLRERGFTNWRDFSSRRDEIERGITFEVIRRESSVTWEQVLENHRGCNTIYELSCKIGCTEKSIMRRVVAHGFESWTDFKEKSDPQFIRNASKRADYVGGGQLPTNHKVVDVRPAGCSQVYNITVEEHHNLAAGSIICDEHGNEKLSHCFYFQSEMEFTPEIASALDIYADESTSANEHHEVLRVTSKDAETKQVLEALFYDILNIEFNVWSWTRNLCKYGDFCLFVDASETNGILNLLPIPINEIEREEGYDPDDPFAVRFRWLTQGNAILEAWQIIHFRLLGNDSFLPYGSSIIEPARRIWRQLILIEDAMLVYRIVRSPERRVFKIDVGNVPPDQVESEMEQVKNRLRRNQVVDPSTGRVDLRYNPLCNSLKSLILLQDGRLLTLEELIAEWDAGKRDQWVYSVDVDRKRVVPGKVVWAGVTKKDAELVRVTVDDGTWFDVTPDHRFMLRDGTYKRADELSPQEALMPLYRKFTSKEDGHQITGYEKIYDPFSQTYVTTHRNNVIQTKGAAVLGGGIVHHADFDKRNNNPENLMPMSWAEHHELHGKSAAEYNRSPVGRANSSRRMKRTWAEGGIVPQTFVELWKDDEVRQKRVQKLSLQTDARLLDHFFRVMDAHGRGLKTKESEFRRRLNEDVTFISYLGELNPSFKNGFADRLTKGTLQRLLKQHGFVNAFTEFKRCWLLSRTNMQSVIGFCQSRDNSVSRKDVLAAFSLSPADLREIVTLSGFDYDDFVSRHMTGSLRYRQYKNHKVVSVVRLAHREDVGCITVEGHPNFACGGSVECHAELISLSPRARADRLLNNYIYLHNSVDEDYFIPVRGQTGSDITTLPGGQFTGDIDDVNYIQGKMFAALKVPKAYLGYEGELGSKATLAQQDVRFARTIERVQKILCAELNKIAIIHLYLLGYRGEQLTDFELKMTSASNIAEQQKLELWRAKFEIAGTASEGVLDRETIYKRIFGLSDDEIEQVREGKKVDKLEDLVLEAMQAPSAEPPPPPEGGEEPPAEPEELPGEEELPKTLGGAPGGEGGTQPEAVGRQGSTLAEQETDEGCLTCGRVDCRLSADEHNDIAERHNPGSEGDDALIAVDKGKDLFSTGEDQHALVFGTEKQAADDPGDLRALRRVITRPFGEGVRRDATRALELALLKSFRRTELLDRSLRDVNRSALFRRKGGPPSGAGGSS